MSTGPCSVKHSLWALVALGVAPELSLSDTIRTVLAVQNMEASGAIMKDQEIEFSALCGSLSMMSKGVRFYDSHIVWSIKRRSYSFSAERCAWLVRQYPPSPPNANLTNLVYTSNRMDSGKFEFASRVCGYFLFYSLLTFALPAICLSPSYAVTFRPPADGNGCTRIDPRNWSRQ